jgi:hypothetical protein
MEKSFPVLPLANIRHTGAKSSTVNVVYKRIHHTFIKAQDPNPKRPTKE